MALAAIFLQGLPPGLGSMARGWEGGDGKGAGCKGDECALVREWGTLLLSGRTYKSLLFFYLYIDLRNFWEKCQLREGAGNNGSQ